MKQVKFLVSAVLIGLSFTACKRDGFDTTKSGLKYKLYTKKEGPKPKEGDLLTMEMVFKRMDKDSVLMDTYKTGTPVKTPLQKPSFKGALEEGFAMLSVGDSASFEVSADSIYLKTFHAPELPPFLKKGSKLLFTVKLLKIQTREELENEYKTKMDAAKKAEGEEMQKYLSENKVTVKPSETGLYVIVKQAGKGAQAASGKTVLVNYTGKLMNGKIFDTSVESVAKEAGLYNPQRKYEPIQIKLGENSVIPGWEEGLKTMKEGGKSVFVIPSSQAYGAQGAGQGAIPPYSPLVFDLELVSVK